MPKVGERVTVVLRGWADQPVGWRARTTPGHVNSRLSKDDDVGAPMSGFSVKPCRGRADEQINLWELDPDFAEGVGWCRGWDGPAVDALKSAYALR